MKLAVHKRAITTKGETNKLRREGNIPAILYGGSEPGLPLHLKSDEIKTILRNLQPGLLATTVFELHEGSHKHKAIIKDIQYQVATYEIEHIDFARLSTEREVTLNVPIRLVGSADCVGVKLGGFIRQVARYLKVTCLPKHIPQEIVIDVRDMNIGQSKRFSDIALPAGVRSLNKLDGVAVIIGKKSGT